MFAFLQKILVTAVLLSVVLFPINVFASNTVNPEILNRIEKTPYATYNSCGGNIEVECDELIILEYKPDEQYDNNEFCVWVIRNNDQWCQGSLFTKTKSGFEVGYDYIQLSGFADVVGIGDGPSYSEKMGRTTSMEQVGHTAFFYYLIFTTDSSNTGTGFRMEIVGYSKYYGYVRWWDDFISTSPSGTTSLIPYPQLMMQSFLIAPKHTSLSALQLDIEYYTVENDFLAVFTMERNGQSINFRAHSKKLIGEGRATFVTVYYTNFAIFCYSGVHSIPATAGVTLTWVPVENVTITTENYI